MKKSKWRKTDSNLYFAAMKAESQLPPLSDCKSQQGQSIFMHDDWASSASHTLGLRVYQKYLFGGLESTWSPRDRVSRDANAA